MILSVQDQLYPDLEEFLVSHEGKGHVQPQPRSVQNGKLFYEPATEQFTQLDDLLGITKKASLWMHL